MKNLIYFLAIALLITSCKKEDKSPTSEPTPQGFTPPSFGLNNQAPFSRNAPKVKLHKVFIDGNLMGEYFYADGYLSEVKNYVTYNDVKPWFTTTFKRNGGFLETYATRYAPFSPEGGSVADLPKDGYVVKLETPINDSIQMIMPVAKGNENNHTRVLFNDKGFVIQVENRYKSFNEEGYIYYYKRDVTNNIIELYENYLPATQPSAKKSFRYDSHSNPFFDTGVFWYAKELSNYALTPNNIIEESGPSVKIHYEGKYYHILSHEYEYLPNGYPRKDTAYITVVDANGKEQKVIQRVMEYRYY